MGVIVRFVGIRWIYGGNRWTVVFTGSYNIPYEKIGDEIHSLADYAPFEIPETWEWCRVGDLFTNMSGLAYKKETLDIKSDRMIRVMRGGNIGDERYYFKADDVFISDEFVKPELFLKKNYMITPAVSSLEHIGKIAMIEEDLEDTVVGGFVLMLIPLFNDDILSKFLLYALAAKNHRDNCRSITHKSGQAFYNLSRELLMNLPIPLPPRSEMARIITKLEEVLPFVDSYCEVKRESTALNHSFPDALKKSILQWAVQGKLVPQAPSDEPAEALLERIRGEKERLVREGKIKKDKHESVIFRRDNSHYEKLGEKVVCIDDEIPFDIPVSWEWIRLGSIGDWGSGATPSRSNPEYYNGDIPWLKTGDLNDGYITNIPESISKEALQKTSVRLNPAGSILMAMYGATIGKLGILTYPATTNQACCACMPVYGIEPLYVFYYLMSQRTAFIKRGEGGAQPNISKEKIVSTLMPLPPLAEQHRIVAKIEELIPLVKTL